MEGLRRKMIFAMFSAYGLSACATPVPSLGRGLPRTFVPTPDFDRRIVEQFPVGSEENKLLAELHGERFSITENQDRSKPYRFSALYVAQNIPCRESWRIQWNAEQGRIVDITGWYSGEVCL